MSHHSNLFIHDTSMLHLLKNAKWIVLIITAFSARQSQIFGSQILKNSSQFTQILEAMENKIYHNIWNAAYIQKVNLCWNIIHTWILILESLFYYVLHPIYENSVMKNHCAPVYSYTWFIQFSC